MSRADFLQQVHPEDLPQMHDRWQLALSSGSRYENEYRILHRNGTIHYCHTIATVTRDGDGLTCSVLGMSCDVTDEHHEKYKVFSMNFRSKMGHSGYSHSWL